MSSAIRPTALVTGASSGIGIELARVLAKDGHDLILAARRLEPMQRLADELTAHGAGCTIIAADLSQPAAAARLVGDIESRGLAVDVLINNAGLGDNRAFADADPLRIHEILHVNVVALTELTRLLLPAMVQRRRGKIMLVASTAAFQPGPYMAVYCATKAYVLSFGEALYYELRGAGVTVTILCPGSTPTEFAQVAHSQGASAYQSSLPQVMTAADVASIGYRALKAGRRCVIPGVRNKVMAFLGAVLPRFVSMPVAAKMLAPPREDHEAGSGAGP